MNSQQQPIIQETVYYPRYKFGHTAGYTQLTCRFPNLRLNVGQFYLRTFLSDPPGGEGYETLEGVAHFEVVRSDSGSPWGWKADACAYHEDCTWDTSAVTPDLSEPTKHVLPTLR